MAHFYGWGSTASRIEPLHGGSLLFTTSPQKFLVLTSSTSEEWKAESNLEPPRCFEHETLDWESSALTTTRILSSHPKSFLAGIYLFRVNIRNTTRIKEICSKLAIKTTERRQKRPSFFIVKCERISNIVLMFPLKPLSK